MQLFFVNFAIELKENIISVTYVSEIAEVLSFIELCAFKMYCAISPISITLGQLVSSLGP